MQTPIVRSGPANRHRIETLVKRGELTRLHRGVYAFSRLVGTPEVRAAAALAAAPDGVVSHDTAAALWGIDLVNASGREHVTVPKSRRRASRSTLVVHASDLRETDLATVRRIRVTSAPRTLHDLLTTCDRLTAVWAVEQALRQKLIERAELSASLRPVRAREWCALADERSESPLETAVRLVLVDGGLPPPELQIPVQDGVFRIDLGYREFSVGIEADGKETHDRPDAIYADRWRANALNQLGWRLLRFTWRDVMARPGYIVASVRAALESSAA
ncbi:MAG TPA: DUF559 domain-containing protein [Mycobacteriales bacterium]|nr:DUF559 domain-containing protein [Mycobacteriales bacterium]